MINITPGRQLGLEPGTGNWYWVYQKGCQTTTIYNERYVSIHNENAW